MEKPIKKLNIIETKSIISFSIFIVCVIKYILVNKLEIIAKYGSSNRLISWAFILPLSIVGLFFSMWVIKKFRNTLFKKDGFINVILTLPMILSWIYFVMVFIFSFLRVLK